MEPPEPMENNAATVLTTLARPGTRPVPITIASM
jgi:hypothetical protein